MQKITYATLGSLGDDFHREFESALKHERRRLGGKFFSHVNGQALKSRGPVIEDRSPHDVTVLLGEFRAASTTDANRAVAGARDAYNTWSEMGWRDRVAYLRKAAEMFEKNQFELAALLTLEVGKNRFEAIAEVSEAIDLLVYYSNQMESHHGYAWPMVTQGPEQTRTVLRPFGVWAVISPFNFPLALPVGMIAGALLGGNTVVFKPASETPLTGLRIYELFHKAGLPVGVMQFLVGDGDIVGKHLAEHDDIAGIAFTGSRAVGLDLMASARKVVPKPCIVEMGGKNPAIIMPSANLADAVEGVARSAFGMSGQKCSACSRVYVHEKVQEEFLERLITRTHALVVGDPAERETFVGPVINAAAVTRFQKAMRSTTGKGKILTGGNLLKKSFPDGYYVEPTIVEGMPQRSPLFQEELFLPLLAVAGIRRLDEAIELANDSVYGLTAGIFTNEEHEQERFFDQIAAGVAYSNRGGGATTGAWPGVQSFGGWKLSGSTGKNALGPYYISQFMREQSQTRMQRTTERETRR